MAVTDGKRLLVSMLGRRLQCPMTDKRPFKPFIQWKTATPSTNKNIFVSSRNTCHTFELQKNSLTFECRCEQLSATIIDSLTPQRASSPGAAEADNPSHRQCTVYFNHWHLPMWSTKQTAFREPKPELRPPTEIFTCTAAGSSLF